MNSIQRKHHKQDKHDLEIDRMFKLKIYSEKEKMKFIDKILLGIGLSGLFLYSLEQMWLLIYEWDIIW